MARKEYYQQNGSWLSELGTNEQGGLTLQSGKPYTSLFGYGSWYDKYNTLSYRNVASGSISNTSAYIFQTCYWFEFNCRYQKRRVSARRSWFFTW